MKIVFFGTPDFGLPALSLLATVHQIVAVVTAVDKPSGRGSKLVFSAVKQAALQMGVPVLQPANLKSDAFVNELNDLKADIFVIIAFRMLPEKVWNLPPLGSVNLHASLLPAYRGAAPINWAIINGESQTGLTTFSLQHQIDTGDIWFQEPQTIDNQDDFGTLYQKLSQKGAALLLQTLEAIEHKTHKPTPQHADPAAPKAPKILPETCILPVGKTAFETVNHIRGLSPKPAVNAVIGQKLYKIFQAQSTQIPIGEAKQGTWKSDQKTYLWFAAKDYWVNITQIRPEGRKTMQVGGYLQGATFDLE